MQKNKSTNKPLVSVIVPTKNSEEFIAACLKSIKAQTYKNIELIVVDNFSTDATPKIAKKYADKFYQQGPERSAQVNYGVTKAKGQYVYKVDSDFTLDKHVVQQCIDKISEGFDAVVVHNTPDESVSWIAKIRKFEVDMYKYDITHSSARFVKKTVYQAIKGFDPNITAGEDYDFQNKLKRAHYKTGFIDAEAIHHGEPKKLWPHLKKYYEYGNDFKNYRRKNNKEAVAQLSPIRKVYIRNWKTFVIHPIKTVIFVIYSSLKYLFGGMGYIRGDNII